jgi:8-oxo-dGTP pyrophosphatase MutT (NUDIX family)
MHLDPAIDGELVATHSDGQDWSVSWHGPGDLPAGTRHGAAGVCVTSAGLLVLISADGHAWDFPAGRPEGEETDEETLRREMREEACAEVLDARLLGYARSECVMGREHGLVLVRSFWRAVIRVGAWRPEFEIQHRVLAPPSDIARYVGDADSPFTRIHQRALVEAGIAV